MHANPDLASIDAVLGLIDREVWIVTAAEGERRGGLVATWVSAASIDLNKPALLAGLAPNHFTAELVQHSRAFAAHLLRPDQIEVAWNFAKDSGRERDKFNGLITTTHATARPVLDDCLAWCDCRVFARYDAGDRLFFWADIVAGTLRVPLPPDGTRSVPATEQPLREQAFISQLTPEQRQLLGNSRQADIQIHRPWHEKWRNSHPW